MAEAVMESRFGMFKLERFVSYLSNRIAQKKNEFAEETIENANKELEVDEEERYIEELFNDADEIVLGNYEKRGVGYLHSIRRFFNCENIDSREVVPFSWSSFYHSGFVATVASVVGLPREKPIGRIEVEKGGFNLGDEAGDNGYEEIRVRFNKQVELKDGKVIHPGLVEYRRECSDGVQYYDLFRRDYEFRLNVPFLRRLPGMKRQVDLTVMLPREAFS